MNSPLPFGRPETAQVRFRASDGYELGGELHGIGTADAPARIALIHAGAGIRAQSYSGFAAFLAQAGIPVLLYDYRGIGRSRHGSLRVLDATIEDWAEYDCAAAIAWLRQRFPGAQMLGIAHSIGALVVGGAANAAEQAHLALIGGHTAYYGDYARRYRLPMAALWHGVMPAVTRVVGYFPASRLGLGEDIPGGIALQWAARRSAELRPRHDGRGHERTHRLLDRCAALQLPALSISVSDDAFAGATGTKRLLSYYPQLAPVRQVVLRPGDAGIRRLGHFGFFRRQAGRMLWPRFVTELEASMHGA